MFLIFAATEQITIGIGIKNKADIMSALSSSSVCVFVLKKQTSQMYYPASEFVFKYSINAETLFWKYFIAYRINGCNIKLVTMALGGVTNTVMVAGNDL